jgi:hypothetical protein
MFKFLSLLTVLVVSSETKNTLQKAFPFDDNLCGIMSQSAGLIHGGELSKRDQFPWMAIISVRSAGLWAHTGSGSLISHRHVLAHAISVSYFDEAQDLFPVSTDRVKVLLGTTEYNNLEEEGSLEVDVIKISNHPSARGAFSSLEVNAISVITLDQNLTFTQYIRPVCLWPFHSELSELAGREAFAVGYGRDQVGVDILTRKQLRVTIQTTCSGYYDEELQFQNETRLFCAKGNDEEGGPCYRDIQLYMKVGYSWFIKGFLATTYNYNNGTCSIGYPYLYEDVEPNVSVIKSLMNH